MTNESLNVKFLGKSFNLPSDIITYKREHHYFEEMRQELLAFMLKYCLDYENFPCDVEKFIYDKYIEIGNICVNKLISYDIFDVTVEEIIGNVPEKYTWKFCCDASKNDGIKLFYTSLRDVMLEQTNALLEQTNSFLSQAQEAEYARDSKITGMGFGIITNDIISYGVWAAMENSTIKKQSDKANSEFSSEIDSIIRNGEMKSKVRLSRYSREVWIPNLKNSVDLFIISLFQTYIDALISHGKFDSEAMKHIDMQKSQSILKNISATTNKAGILESALLCCPFNPDVYDIALGVGDIAEIIECAKVFDVTQHIEDMYKDKCNAIALNDAYSEKEIIDRITPFVKIISMLDNDFSLDDLLDTHRKQMREKVLKYSRSLCDNSSSEFKTYIKTLKDFSAYIRNDYSDTELKENIRTKIISDIFFEDEILGYTDTISQAVEKVFESVCDYKHKLINAEKLYLVAQKEYDEFVNTANTEIAEIDEQISKLGIFAFSKKKALTARKSDLEMKIRKLQHNCKEAESAYNSLCS